MKILSSLLVALGVQAQNEVETCTELIIPSCSDSGFVIIIDEICREEEYSYVNFEHAAFVSGNIAVIDKPDPIANECVPAAVSYANDAGLPVAKWTWTFGYSQCDVESSVLLEADENGIAWNVYTVYLNFDGEVSGEYGSGSFQQLDQTKLECKIPANIQQNGLVNIGIVNVDPLEDVSAHYELWDQFELNVYRGGIGANASWNDSAVAAGESIDMGEHVKLKIEPKEGETTSLLCAITNCWAATVQNIADVSYGIAYDPTAGSVAKFYSGMCPVHPWVKPAFGNTVDTVNPANADQNLEVTLRQFKFSNTKDTDGFYYHCEINICLPGVDCVDDLLNCEVPDYAPGSRRRRAAILSTGSTFQLESETDVTMRRKRQAQAPVEVPQEAPENSSPFRIGRGCKHVENQGEIDVCVDVIKRQAVEPSSGALALTAATIVMVATMI